MGYFSSYHFSCEAFSGNYWRNKIFVPTISGGGGGGGGGGSLISLEDWYGGKEGRLAGRKVPSLQEIESLIELIDSLAEQEANEGKPIPRIRITDDKPLEDKIIFVPLEAYGKLAGGAPLQAIPNDIIVKSFVASGASLAAYMAGFDKAAKWSAMYSLRTGLTELVKQWRSRQPKSSAS